MNTVLPTSQSVSELFLPRSVYLHLNLQTATLGPEIIHTDIRTTDAPLTLEAQPPMQDTPVIENDGLAGLQLDGEQELGRVEDLGPDAGGAVPFLQGGVVGEDGGRGGQAVEIVPADLHQRRRRRRRDAAVRRRVHKHRVPLARRRVVVERPVLRVALRRRQDRIRRQRVVQVRMRRVQVRRRREAVDERALPALPGHGRVCQRRVRQAVEELQARGIREIRGVRVWREVVVGVGRVDRVDFGCEIPESAVVGGADVRDSFDQCLRRLRTGRRVWHEAQAVRVDVGEEVLEARGGCGRRDGVVRHARECRVGAVRRDVDPFPRWVGGTGCLAPRRRRRTGLVERWVSRQPLPGVGALVRVALVPRPRHLKTLRGGLDVGDFDLRVDGECVEKSLVG